MWHLRDHLTACVTSGRLILLDVRRDRYFALTNDSAQPALAWLSAGDGSAAPAILNKLLADGRGEPLTNMRRTDIALPAPAVSQGSLGKADFRSILSVSATVVATGMTLRTQNLGTLLERRRHLRKVALVFDPAELHHRAQIFLAARRWCPVGRNCLLDSLAIDHWLGTPAAIQLVFGVTAQPFEAHCWVQSHCAVLNDSYDCVSRFEPILSV